jgi:hypothetical protein
MQDENVMDSSVLSLQTLELPDDPDDECFSVLSSCFSGFSQCC